MFFNLLYSFIIISQIYHYHFSEIISLSVNSFYKYEYKTNITSIDDLSETYLYSNIYIGDPSYEIKALLSIYHSYFSITKDIIIKGPNDSLTYYDMIKSNSFKNVSNSMDNNYNSIAKEKFILNIFNYKANEYYNITVDDMIFFYNNNKKDINNEKLYNLNIGFQILNKKELKEREMYSFINQLKNRSIIQNYDLCFFFQRGKKNNGSFLYNPDELINLKGELFIGELPDIYNSNFNNKQLLSTYSIYSGTLFKWALEFSNVYYNISIDETKQIYIKDVQLNINQIVILAPMIYNHKPHCIPLKIQILTNKFKSHDHLLMNRI
jgi:hypothetical protein